MAWPSIDLVGGMEANPLSESSSSFLSKFDLIEIVANVPSTCENILSFSSALKWGVVSVVTIISICLDSAPSSENKNPPKETLHFEGKCCVKNFEYIFSREILYQ